MFCQPKCTLRNDGFICIQVGESFVTEDCGKQCTCTESKGDLKCTDMECPENEVCVLRDGEYGCYCEPPFTKIDNECKGEYSAKHH